MMRGWRVGSHMIGRTMWEPRAIIPLMSSHPLFEYGLMFWWDVHYWLRGRHHMHRFTFASRPNDWDYQKLFTELTVQLNGRIMRHRSNMAVNLLNIYTELWPVPGNVIPIPTIIPGDRFAHSAPNSVAAVMKMRTGLPGRMNRGRKFLVGIPEEDWNGMFLKPDVMREISITWRALEQIYSPDFDEYPLQWGVLHRYVNGSRRLPIITNFWPFTNLSLNARRMRHEWTAFKRGQ